MTTTPAGLPPYQAWFTRRPALALGGIAALFAVITALRAVQGSDPNVAVTLFYVVPVSLAALAWGRLAAGIAIAVALALLFMWVGFADVELTPLGYAARVVPIVLAGLLLGDASDRLRRAERAHLEQVERELLHRQAVEVNDSLLQGISAAKWAVEAGNDELALKALDDTLRAGQTLVSGLIREAGLGPVHRAE